MHQSKELQKFIQLSPLFQSLSRLSENPFSGLDLNGIIASQHFETSFKKLECKTRQFHQGTKTIKTSHLVRINNQVSIKKEKIVISTTQVRDSPSEEEKLDIFKNSLFPLPKFKKLKKLEMLPKKTEIQTHKKPPQKCARKCDFHGTSTFLKQLIEGNGNNLMFGFCDLCYAMEKIEQESVRKFRISLRDLILKEQSEATSMGIYEVVDFKAEDPESAFFCFECALRIHKSHPSLKLRLKGPQVLLQYILVESDYVALEKEIEDQTRHKIDFCFTFIRRLILREMMQEWKCILTRRREQEKDQKGEVQERGKLREEEGVMS